MKICSKCKVEKPLDSYYKNGSSGVRSICKDCDRFKASKWNKANKEKHCKSQKTWREINRVESRLQRKKYVENHPDTVKQTNKNYRNKNINAKLASRLRVRLNAALNNNQKIGSAVRNLGCSIEELKIYIETRFQPGMTWDNWSITGWHLDHIKPLAKFDLTKEEDLKEACHYTNLQPLWAMDNLQKGDKT